MPDSFFGEEATATGIDAVVQALLIPTLSLQTGLWLLNSAPDLSIKYLCVAHERDPIALFKVTEKIGFVFEDEAFTQTDNSGNLK